MIEKFVLKGVSTSFFFQPRPIQNYNIYKRVWEEELEKADTEHILGHLKLCAFHPILRRFYFHRQWEDF